MVHRSCVPLNPVVRRCQQGLVFALLGFCLLVGLVQPAAAITAPELRSQRSLQDLQPDMHGRNLQQQEFLKASLVGFDLSDSDLRGAVFNSSDLKGSNLQGANLEDVVAYASHFEDSDLSNAVLRNAMLMCTSRRTFPMVEA